MYTGTVIAKEQAEMDRRPAWILLRAVHTFLVVRVCLEVLEDKVSFRVFKILKKDS